MAVRPGKTVLPAQSVAGSADSGRRRMLPNRSAMTDTVCANGRDGRVLGARNTSGGVYPGRGVEEPTQRASAEQACLLCRAARRKSPSGLNSGQVKLYLGGTVTKVVWQTRSDTRPLAPGRPQAKRLRRQDPRIPSWLKREIAVEY